MREPAALRQIFQSRIHLITRFLRPNKYLAVVSISYNLDEGANSTFTDLGNTGEFPSESGKAVAYHTEMLSLSNLTDGTHILKAYSLDKTGNEMKNSVEFTVNSTIITTPTPTPTIPELSLLMVVPR